jgi:hypothetical protein
MVLIEFAPLSSVAPEKLRALNDRRVLRHMPLASSDPMGVDELRDWVVEKEAITERSGYGPQAILVDGEFAGWGGLEPDGEGASISLVLLPAVWGLGRKIMDALLDEAFGRLRLPYVLVEFPPSRRRVRGLLRMGFHAAGEREIAGKRFIVYRLDAPTG